jgi:hypothetical protein
MHRVQIHGIQDLRVHCDENGDRNESSNPITRGTGGGLMCICENNTGAMVVVLGLLESWQCFG